MDKEPTESAKKDENSNEREEEQPTSSNQIQNNGNNELPPRVTPRNYRRRHESSSSSEGEDAIEAQNTSEHPRPQETTTEAAPVEPEVNEEEELDMLVQGGVPEEDNSENNDRCVAKIRI